MKSKKISYETIAALNPCWLTNGRGDELRSRVGKGITATRIAQMTDVSISDRRWVLTQYAASTKAGRKLLVMWAAGCAQDVAIKLDGDDYDDAQCAIDIAVAWTEGCATEQDCRDAAESAARSARSDAARSVADAAWSDADAAWSARSAAARSARSDADAERQLVMLANMLETL